MRKILALLIACLMLAACGGSSSQPTEILVAAAASLEKTYADTLIPMFQDKYPHITVKGSYDSSGKLQTQIEEGMEAVIFMSAATKQMTALDEDGFVAGDTIVNLLENEIVLIAPIDSDIDISSFEDIPRANTIAIGDPESVPAGQYAREALTSLSIYDDVLARASLGTNVTEVLNWVAEGSADVGIVYATDAASRPDDVKVIATAPEGSLEKPVIYPMCILKNGENNEAAKLFWEFLKSPEALAVFEENGFKVNI